ncbi:hypothetical protein [Phormidesmis priestleyi]
MYYLKRLSLPILLSILVAFTLVSKAQAGSRMYPKLISPTNRAVLDNGCEDASNDVSWTFEWSSPTGDVTRSHLYVIGPGTNKPVINKSNIRGTSYTEKGVGAYIVNQNRRGWRWKVRALLGGQVWTDWSEEKTFDVEPLNTDCRR